MIPREVVPDPATVTAVVWWLFGFRTGKCRTYFACREAKKWKIGVNTTRTGLKKIRQTELGVHSLSSPPRPRPYPHHSPPRSSKASSFGRSRTTTRNFNSLCKAAPTNLEMLSCTPPPHVCTATKIHAMGLRLVGALFSRHQSIISSNSLSVPLAHAAHPSPPASIWQRPTCLGLTNGNRARIRTQGNVFHRLRDDRPTAARGKDEAARRLRSGKKQRGAYSHPTSKYTEGAQSGFGFPLCSRRCWLFFFFCAFTRSPLPTPPPRAAHLSLSHLELNKRRTRTTTNNNNTINTASAFLCHQPPFFAVNRQTRK